MGQLNPFADFCAEVGHRVYFIGSRCFPSSEKLTIGLRSILKVSDGRQVALYNVFIRTAIINDIEQHARNEFILFRCFHVSFANRKFFDIRTFCKIRGKKEMNY